ncbi:MFS transporter [Gemmatimonas sp.]|uniref:MFS transporter n=1 Tax=Gemmatimonas sp. TaxID=1962908 RepID=UPI00286D967F|nr:MFS transporter [Gemmatimonas sp.]
MSSIPPTHEPAPARRWMPTRNVLALAAVSFLTDASSEIIAPLLPLFLVGTLGATVSMVGVIEGSAEAVASLLKLASGWWSDRVSRRKPLIVAGYTIASLVRPLVAIAQSATQVLAIRLVDRVGKGIRGAPRDALLADSTPPEFRGRAFGFHRAADHAGAVVGPLIALACLQWLGMPVRQVFWVAAIPGALAVLVAIAFVREQHDSAVAPAGRPVVTPTKARTSPAIPASALPRSFWLTMLPILVFTLGNSTDAFLLLRASQLGVPTALIPLVWVLLHLVKSASSTPAGALSDRVGRRPLIVAGWGLYAAVYAGFSRATDPWHAWALFGVYGVVFGLTEGTEKALVADLVPAARRGTAFGWYQATVGVAALPASIVFGVVWDRYGSPAAFGMGAVLAVVAAVIMSLVALTPAEA